MQKPENPEPLKKYFGQKSLIVFFWIFPTEAGDFAAEKKRSTAVEMCWQRPSSLQACEGAAQTEEEERLPQGERQGESACRGKANINSDNSIHFYTLGFTSSNVDANQANERLPPSKQNSCCCQIVL